MVGIVCRTALHDLADRFAGRLEVETLDGILLDAIALVLVVFRPAGYRPPMTDPPEKLTPADPRDLAEALAFALRYQGRKRVHNADEITGGPRPRDEA